MNTLPLYPKSGGAGPRFSDGAAARETSPCAFELIAEQLAAIQRDLTELKKAAAVSTSMAAVYHKFRLAFFEGQPEPLAIPNVDYLIFSLLAGGVKYAGYDPTAKRIYLTKDGVLFTTDAYFYIVLEVFGKEEYRIVRSLVDRPFVVYDLGMNRGYASLWFANHPLCRKVYGFELLPEPFRWAQENFALNPRLAPKVESFCVGLGGENKEVELFFEDATDGVSTVIPEFYAGYWSENRKKNRRSRRVTLRKASEVLSELPPCAAGESRVLKIDVEGAEYDIVANLARAGMLDFDVILAETHLGVDKFLALVPGYDVVDVAWHSAMLVNLALVRSKAQA